MFFFKVQYLPNFLYPISAPSKAGRGKKKKVCSPTKSSKRTRRTEEEEEEEGQEGGQEGGQEEEQEGGQEDMEAEESLSQI
jgi:hypothetical protein